MQKSCTTIFAVFLATPYKDIRMAVGMSQKAFAEHIGVIPSYYYKNVAEMSKYNTEGRTAHEDNRSSWRSNRI